MQLSEQGIALIKGFEKCRLSAYRDSALVYTIGWGNTRYENGRRVTPGDKISLQRADDLFKHFAEVFTNDVNYLTKGIPLKQHQFDALVSFAYNVGSDMNHDGIAQGLGDSTLMKIIKKDPADPKIESEFLKWVKAGNKPLEGLKRRRRSEAHLYTTGELDFFE